jgi:YidC/Oxa1 family membrane protein insertase
MSSTLATLVFGISDILQPLEDAVRWLLDRFHYDLGLPWAWAIVTTTVAVRILLVPLTVRQIHSMQSMQRHAPEMKEIQRKYKGDRQKLNEELMKFYKENHINPAASCLPLLAQLPVFLALYLVLSHFAKNVPVEPGGGATDLSWLNIVPDITAKANSHWSGYLLLVIYAGSQILSTYFMSATMEKAQRIVMMVVPLIFISVIAHFPAGLVIYWVTTNLWTVGQGLITRRLMPKTPAPSIFNRNPKKPPDGGNGAKKPVAPAPKPAPAAQAAVPPPRRVKRKKKGGARR